MASMPKRISPQWLKSRKTFLDCTVKTLDDGTPNPIHVEAAAEVAEAEAEMARRAAFEAWMKGSFGMIPNLYPLRCDSRSYEPGKAFFRKDKATGLTQAMPQEAAWEAYSEAHKGE